MLENKLTSSTLTRPYLALVPEEQRAEIQMVESAFNALYARDGISYLSTPITSGLQLYKTLREHNITDPKELYQNKELLFSEVIQPNIRAAHADLERLMLDLPGAVIAPSVFEAKSRAWTQPMYMAMWLAVIDEKVTQIVMRDGWEYSNGSVDEYFMAVMMKSGFRQRTSIDIVDARLNPISFSQGFDRVCQAAIELQEFIPPSFHIQTCHKLHLVASDVQDLSDLEVPEGRQDIRDFEIDEVQESWSKVIASGVLKRYDNLMMGLKSSTLWGDIANSIEKRDAPRANLPQVRKVGFDLIEKPEL